eukprot:3777067-Prymnesium_polylepis.1
MRQRRGGQRGGRREDHVVSQDVARALGRREEGVVDRAGCVEQPHLVDEREERDGLPLLPLAVGVEGEGRGERVEHGRRGREHQVAVRVRHELRRLRRQDGEELRERRERRALLQLDRVGAEAAQVGGERRVEVGVVPVPRAAAL